MTFLHPVRASKAAYDAFVHDFSARCYMCFYSQVRSLQKLRFDDPLLVVPMAPAYLRRKLAAIEETVFPYRKRPDFADAPVVEALFQPASLTVVTCLPCLVGASDTALVPFLSFMPFLHSLASPSAH